MTGGPALKGWAYLHHMSQKAIRATLSAIVVLAAIGGLMAMSLKSNQAYYLHVDEVMASPDQWYGKNLQMHGHVVDGSIMRRPNTLDYRFQVENNGKIVTANYTGIVPDTFKDGSEVVLRGRLTPHDGFEVQPKDGIMAKCPSKYDPASAPAGATAGRPAAGLPAATGGLPAEAATAAKAGAR